MEQIDDCDCCESEGLSWKNKEQKTKLPGTNPLVPEEWINLPFTPSEGIL